MGLKMTTPKVLKSAVCALLSNLDSYVLGVSQKDNRGLFEMPGGKNEFLFGAIYEPDVNAVIRVIREQTGLELDPDSIREVYRGPRWSESPDQEDYEVVTFTANWSGDISSQEGNVKWIPAHILVAPGMPYWWYNWEVYRRLGVTP